MDEPSDKDVVANQQPRDEEEANTYGAQPRDAFDIFISYRVRPDEELAGELKTLLESAIDPRPRVFVSGLGGLRASADSYREQLRVAARGARAYVGLITKASVDREWIFFEAGAAFGRGVLYAPVLVDLAPSELPSSIGGYQGVRAADQTRVRELVEDLAKATGGTCRSHFAQRYGRFAKAVDGYGASTDEEDLSPTARAVRLAELGRRAEAEQLFDDLIGQAESDEERARQTITKVVFLSKQDVLEQLERQPEDVKSTASFKLWAGVYETNPIRAVELLREAYEGSLNTFQRCWALESLSRNEYEIGDVNIAFDRLVTTLHSSDQSLRSVAAHTLAVHLDKSDRIVKLLLFVESTIGRDIDHIKTAVRFCWDNQFVPIGAHLADACLEKKDDGNSRLYRGLVRSQAGLRSLAFADYRAAAKEGISVAKSNMASMLSHDSVAEAGLEILRSHSGDYSSSDPGSPYEIRASLERAVAEEEASEREILAYGRKIATAVHRLFASWMRRGCEQIAPAQRYCAEGRSDVWQLDLQVTMLTCTLNENSLVIRQASVLPGMYYALDDEKLRLLVVVGQQVEAVSFDGLEGAGTLEWLRFEAEPGPDLQAVPEVKPVTENSTVRP